MSAFYSVIASVVFLEDLFCFELITATVALSMTRGNRGLFSTWPPSRRISRRYAHGLHTMGDGARPHRTAHALKR